LADVGSARLLQEDAWGTLPLPGGDAVFVVVDGIGGQSGADEVAVATMQGFLQSWVQAGLQGAHLTRAPGDLLRDGFRGAWSAQRDAAGDCPGFSCKMTGALVRAGEVWIGHIGDTRAYRHHPGGLTQITRDHTLAEKYLQMGRITPEEVSSLPIGHIVLRTLAADLDFVEPDVFRCDLEPGDTVILCTDGLWRSLDDKRLRSILGHAYEPRRAVRALVEAALAGGSADNLTAVAVRR